MRAARCQTGTKIGLHIGLIRFQCGAVFVLYKPAVQALDIASVGLAGIIAKTALKPEGCRKTLQLRLDKTMQLPKAKALALGELFLDACCLTRELAQVVKLRLTYITTTLNRN